MLAKLYLSASTLVIGDVLARYRQHPESLVHRLEREGTYVPGWPNPAHRAFVEWLQDYVAARGVADRALHAALREEQWPYHHPWAWRLRHLPALSMRGVRGWRSAWSPPPCSNRCWTGGVDRRRPPRRSERLRRANASQMPSGRQSRNEGKKLNDPGGSLLAGSSPGSGRWAVPTLVALGLVGSVRGGRRDRADDPAVRRDDRHRRIGGRRPLRPLDAAMG